MGHYKSEIDRTRWLCYPYIAHKDRQEVEISPRGKSYLVFFDDKRRLLVIKKGKTHKGRVGLAWYFNVYPNEMEALN